MSSLYLTGSLPKQMFCVDSNMMNMTRNLRYDLTRSLSHYENDHIIGFMQMRVNKLCPSVKYVYGPKLHPCQMRCLYYEMQVYLA